MWDDSFGSARAIPAWRKFELSTYAEYGLTEFVTLIGDPSWFTFRAKPPGVSRTRLGAAEAGDLTRFSTILARALRVARSAIERLALDAGGEPFALIFAAMGLSATESQRPILSLRSDLAAALADPMSGTRLALQAPPRAAGAILAALLPGRPRPATAGEYAQTGARAQESGAPALGATTTARAVNRA